MKSGDVPAAASTRPQKSTRSKEFISDSTPSPIEEVKKPKIQEVAAKRNVGVLKPITENTPLEPKKSEKEEAIVVDRTDNEKAEVCREKPKRGRQKVELPESGSNDDCPSPAKRTRRTTRSKAVDEAVEKAKKLTPTEVKKKLGGVKKLSDLKEQLKKIEKSAETVQQAKAKAAAAAKKVADEKAKVEAKVEYETTPAYISYQTLAAKGDGTLPLPATYKFLAEVFR